MAAATPIANPTREPLEWETPSASKKPGILSKYNIFSTSPQPQPAVTKEEGPGAERNAPEHRSNRFIPHWTSRKTCFYTLAALLVLVLILALGLGIGLGIHNGWVNLNTFHPGTGTPI